VDEIERSLRERVGAEVVAEDLNIGSIDGGEKIELQIRCGHSPVRADEFREPTRDRAPTAAYLETQCAGPDAESLDAPHGQRIETLLKELEAARLVGGGVRKRVIGRFAHRVILSLCCRAVQSADRLAFASVTFSILASP
jgi:hypothetical protein